MLGPITVVLNQVVHYLVKYPKSEHEVRKLVVAAGTCNDIPFEATAINDPGFSTYLDLFRKDERKFSKLEHQSIKMRIKMSTPTKIVDLRGESEGNKYEYFYNQMCEKYYGKKIYLKVHFSRKEEAKALGAKWDAAEKKWFIFANSPTLLQIEKHFNWDEL